MNHSTLPPATAFVDADALEHRLALRIAAALGERAAAAPADVQERLRFAREQALVRAAAARGPALAGSAVDRSGGLAVLGGSWRWLQAAAWAPLAVLLVGLLAIDRFNFQEQIRAAADIDAQLLADDLPPAAYSDAGFVEFLRLPPAAAEAPAPP